MRRAWRWFGAVGLLGSAAAAVTPGCGAPQGDPAVVHVGAPVTPPVTTAEPEAPEIPDPQANGGDRRKDPRPSPEPTDAELDRERARGLFQEGAAAYQEGDYQRACISFHAAYDLVPVDALLFNIGSCELRMGHVAEACAIFRQYVAKGDPSSPRIQEVTQQIAQRCRGTP